MTLTDAQRKEISTHCGGLFSMERIIRAKRLIERLGIMHDEDIREVARIADVREEDLR